MTSGIYASLNSQLSEQLALLIPSSFLTDIFINNPLLFLLIFLGVGIIIAMTMKLMSNLWKLPFAIVVDLLDVLSISSPIRFNFIAAIGSFLLILFFVRDEKLKKIFWVVGCGEALVGLPLFFPSYGAITNVFPMNTLIVFVSIFLRK